MDVIIRGSEGSPPRTRAMDIDYVDIVTIVYVNLGCYYNPQIFANPFLHGQGMGVDKVI